MRGVHMEVFPSPLNRVHMVALLSDGCLTSSGRVAALVALFSDGGIWLREEEHGTILRAPAHMEAITSKLCSSATLPQSKWNHRKPRGSRCSPAIGPPTHSALVLIIISFSAAVPSQWLEALKVLFQLFKTEEDEAEKEINNGALVLLYICQALTFKYLCLPQQN